MNIKVKRAEKIVIALSLFWVPGAGLSQTSLAPVSSPGAPAVVTISFNAAVLATTEAQRDLRALQTKFAPRGLQIQKLNEGVEAARKQLGDSMQHVSESEAAARRKDLDDKEKQLQRQAEDYRNDSQAESQVVFQRVAEKLFGLVQEYSRQHGYSLVIERGTNAAPIVWYAAAGVDITEQVAKAYDARYKQPSGLPAPIAPAR